MSSLATAGTWETGETQKMFDRITDASLDPFTTPFNLTQ